MPHLKDCTLTVLCPPVSKQDKPQDSKFSFRVDVSRSFTKPIEVPSHQCFTQLVEQDFLVHFLGLP